MLLYFSGSRWKPVVPDTMMDDDMEELNSPDVKQDELNGRNEELRNKIAENREELELMKRRYTYLERKYEDAKVRLETMSVEGIYDGMVREQEAVDVLMKLDLLEKEFRCFM